jgi:hypothetical protein
MVRIAHLLLLPVEELHVDRLLAREWSDHVELRAPDGRPGAHRRRRSDRVEQHRLGECDF